MSDADDGRRELLIEIAIDSAYPNDGRAKDVVTSRLLFVSHLAAAFSGPICQIAPKRRLDLLQETPCPRRRNSIS